MKNFTSIRREISAKLFVVLTIVSLLFTALPVGFFVAEAVSTGVTVNNSTLTTTVDELVNFVVSVSTDDATSSPGTVVAVSDNDGGSFYAGTIGGDCNNTTPDTNNEFSITESNGICYSNSVADVYTVTVQLLDGSDGVEIGAPETIVVTVEAAKVLEKPIYGCMDDTATNYISEATEPGEVLCEYPLKRQTHFPNSCIIPDNLSDNEDFILGTEPEGESSIDTIFTNNGFGSVDVLNDQQNTQVWNFAPSEVESVTLRMTLLGKYSGNAQAFGYYEAGSSTTFVPVFMVGAHSTGVPTLAVGETITITIPNNAAESLGFAMSTEGDPSGELFSEFALNSNNQDYLAVYNPLINIYLLALEDRPDDYPSDDDHNDLVVKIDGIECNEPQESVVISGQAWEDINQDGVIDPGEPTVPGIEICLENLDTAAVSCVDTNELGYYVFDVLDDDADYRVTEKVVPPWVQTAPVGDFCDILNPVLGTEYHCDFGNYKPLTPETFRIGGYKYEVDGVSTTTRANSTVRLEDVDGFVLMSTTTNSNGYYYFDVEAGIYEVYETLQTDWVQVLVEQDGEEVSDYCRFNIPDDESEYMCDFYNEYEGVDEPDTVLGCTDSKALNYNSSATPGNKDAESCEYEEVEKKSSGSSSSGGRPRVQATPQVAGAATTNFCPFLLDHMQMGWSNDPFEVTKLQMFLNLFKDTFGGTINPITGLFGATTDDNVKIFQEYYRSEVLDPWYVKGIVPHNKPTGFVYKTTLWKINSIVCPDYAILPNFEGENLSTNVDLNSLPISD